MARCVARFGVCFSIAFLLGSTLCNSLYDDDYKKYPGNCYETYEDTISFAPVDDLLPQYPEDTAYMTEEQTKEKLNTIARKVNQFARSAVDDGSRNLHVAPHTSTSMLDEGTREMETEDVKPHAQDRIALKDLAERAHLHRYYKYLKIADGERYENQAKAAKLCASLNENLPEGMSAGLLTINSASEQSLVEKYLFQTNKIYDNVWLSLKQEGDVYMWQKGKQEEETVTYTNWAKQQKQDGFGGCVQLESGASAFTIGKWAKVGCGKKNLVVCEAFGDIGGGISANPDVVEKAVLGLARIFLSFKKKVKKKMKKMAKRIKKLKAKSSQDVNEVLADVGEEIEEVRRFADDPGDWPPSDWVTGLFSKSTMESYKRPREMNESTMESDKRPREMNESTLELDKRPREMNESTMESDKRPREMNESTMELDKRTRELNESMIDLDEKTTELNKSTMELDEQTRKLGQSTTILDEPTTELNESTLELDKQTREVNETTMKI